MRAITVSDDIVGLFSGRTVEPARHLVVFMKLKPKLLALGDFPHCICLYVIVVHCQHRVFSGSFQHRYFDALAQEPCFAGRLLCTISLRSSTCCTTMLRKFLPPSFRSHSSIRCRWVDLTLSKCVRTWVSPEF